MRTLLNEKKKKRHRKLYINDLLNYAFLKPCIREENATEKRKCQLSLSNEIMGNYFLFYVFAKFYLSLI